MCRNEIRPFGLGVGTGIGRTWNTIISFLSRPRAPRSVPRPLSAFPSAPPTPDPEMPPAPLALPFIRPCRFHAPAFTPPPPPLALLSQRSITDRPTDRRGSGSASGRRRRRTVQRVLSRRRRRREHDRRRRHYSECPKSMFRGRERRISGGPDRKRERQTDCAAA